MLRCLAVVAVLAASSAPAFADEADPHRVALAVNTPLSWVLDVRGHAFGISGWAGLTEHQAVRANFAAYAPDFHNPLVLDADNECPPRGTVYDVGAAWVYFPRELYSGLSLEIGAVHRSTSQSVTSCDLDIYPNTSEDSVTYAARAMIGWSWTIGEHAFIAAAFGESLGIERGTEQREDQQAMTDTVRIAGWPTTFETYLRFGAAI